MNRGSVLVIHLIELIDEANTLVSKDKCSSFESPFFRDWVFVDSCSETNSTSSFTCGVNTPVEDLLNVLQELRLGCTRISQ